MSKIVGKKKKTASEEIHKQHFSLKDIQPLTNNQRKTFEEYQKGHGLILSGYAGTGKSFLGMYLGLRDITTPGSDYDRIIIIRSAVPTRDLGFVPGTLEEKSKIYQEPYMNIVNELIGRGDAWHIMLHRNIIEFQTTSFLRGLTFRNCVLLFDEIQSASFHEIDTVLTRVGERCRIILCGDCNQNDLVNRKEKSGMSDILRVLQNINGISHIKFTLDDVVRSGFVKEYLREKEKLDL